jgi:hypothetical protein
MHKLQQRRRAVTIITAGIVAVVPLSLPQIAAAQPQLPQAAVSHRPATPGTGHFHGLAPSRVAQTSVAAHHSRPVQIGGHGGVPKSGVLAVSATISAKPHGPTELWSSATSKRPSVPVLATSSQPTSAFAILPVSRNGAVRLFNGAHRPA